MGYMGFGMQSIVNKQKPRKPYKFSRKPSFGPLQNYSRTFKLQPSVKENKRRAGLLSLLILSMLLGFVLLYGVKFTNYSNENNLLLSRRNKENNNMVFQLLMTSGKNRLANNNILGAYSEFKMAYKIYPSNEQLQQLIIETSSVLCVSNPVYCDDLESYLYQLCF